MKNNVLNIILSAPKTTVLALSLSFFISSCHHKKDVEDKITIKSTSSNKVAIVAQNYLSPKRKFAVKNCIRS
ncbi:MAG: hypothetical protein IPI93_11580 [Sphingobacteriaceae bacterium]|nr:hypothetical protein [Sphingobacteriaceae bacterium]